VAPSTTVVRKSSEHVAPPRDLRARVLREGKNAMVLLWFTPSGTSPLTDAECRVAVAIARGRSNAEIARELGVAVRTVANQVAAVLRKLRASSRSEVAARFGIADMA
jgi:DNA-binding NarL/FixJ family response regulator